MKSTKVRQLSLFGDKDVRRERLLRFDGVQVKMDHYPTKRFIRQYRAAQAMTAGLPVSVQVKVSMGLLTLDRG